MKHTINIEINGTDHNPWHIFGLSQQPFPQIGKMEWDAGQMALNSLGGDPVVDEADIEKRLKGKVSRELIDLCIRQFRPGETVRFQIEFDDNEK